MSLLRIILGRKDEVATAISEHNAKPGAHGLPSDVSTLETKAGAQAKADAARDAAIDAAAGSASAALADAQTYADAAAAGASDAANTTIANAIEAHNDQPGAHGLPPVNQIATIDYVNSVASGISSFPAACDVATTGNIALSGEQLVDGFNATAGNRVLVWRQTDPVQNGIYDAQTGAWTRSEDFDTDEEISDSAYVLVKGGDTYGGVSFILSTPEPQTVGSTPLVFVEYGRPDEVTAEAPLVRDGNTIRLPDNTITAAKIAAGNKDGTPTTPSMRTLGTGANQALPGNHASVTNARTPTAHASTHRPGGSDPLQIDPTPASASPFSPRAGISASNTQEAVEAVQANVVAATAKADAAQGEVNAVKSDLTVMRQDINTLQGALTIPGPGDWVWELTDSDDFSGPSIESTRWTIYDGFPGTNGEGWRSAQQARVQSGALQILGSGDTVGGVAHKVNQTYGRYEIRVRMDRGVGYAPTIQLFPQDQQVPANGPINIFRTTNGLVDSATSSTTKAGGAVSTHTETADFSQYHTWTVEWLPDSLTVYLDGRMVWTVTDTTFIPKVPMYVGIHLDVGIPGGTQGIPVRTASTPQPILLHVDYVKVWRAVQSEETETSNLFVVEGGAVKNWISESVPAGFTADQFVPLEAVRVGPGNAVWFDKAPAGTTPTPTPTQPTPTQPTPTQPAPTTDASGVDPAKRALLTEVANTWIKEFVRPDGFVLQKEADNKIVSEGVPYAMTMALLTNNKAVFDLVHKKAKDSMARGLPWSPPEHKNNGNTLLAWSVDAATGNVNDWSYATDAEIDRVRVLWGAFKRWGTASYRDDANAIGSDILNYAMMVDGTRSYMTSGHTNKNRTNGQGYFLSENNLSYNRPLGFIAAKAASGDARWDAINDGGYDQLERATDNTGTLATTAGLPPDWHEYNHSTHDVNAIVQGQRGWTFSRSTGYGYDAFRVIPSIYEHWQQTGSQRALNWLSGNIRSYFSSMLTSTGKIAAELNHDGTVKGNYEGRIFDYAAWMVLAAGTPSAAVKAQADALRSRKLANMVETNSFGKYFANSAGQAHQYYSGWWLWYYEVITSGMVKEIETPFTGTVANPTPTQPQPTPTQPTPVTPPVVGSVKLWVDPDSNVALEALKHPVGSVKRKQAEWGAARSQVCWTGPEWDPNGANANAWSIAAAAEGAVLTLACYGIPGRDLGGDSGGGAANRAAYRTWYQNIINGFKGPTIIVYEPDALAMISGLPEAEQMARMDMMAEATDAFLASPHCFRFYSDGGHSQWLSVEETIRRLKLVNVHKTHGIMFNVSNFRLPAEVHNFAIQVLNGLGMPHLNYSMDTSRNGGTQAPETWDWNNPLGRQFGHDPVFGLDKTGLQRCESMLWVKRPGESDGYGHGGPPAGTWWPEYYFDMASRPPVPVF